MLSLRQLAGTLAVAALVCVGSGFCIWAPMSKGSPARLPDLVLWSWEHPEDLRFLTAPVGVAFLAETIYLQRTHREPVANQDPPASPFVVRPRFQPLRVGPRTPLIAVVRMETQPAERPPMEFPILSSEDRQRLATEIATIATRDPVRAIQIDFDAASSQRPFYAALLQDVRRKLPSEVPLSITALASWCMGDPWLYELPSGTIDEAVPMLFRMGPDAPSVGRLLKTGEDFRVPACQTSLGISTDESLSQQILRKPMAASYATRGKKRIYVFNPRPWTQSSADRTVQEWRP